MGAIQRKGLAGFVAVVIVAALDAGDGLRTSVHVEVLRRDRELPVAQRAAWGGALPTLAGDGDCAPSGDVTYGAVKTDADAAADPVGDAVSSFVYTSNLRPLGYSARNLPLNSSLSGINSDLAFKDNLVIQGNWDGFRIIDVADPANPIQLVNYAGCAHPSGQGDVVVYGNLLVWTADAPADATHMCGGELVGLGFEGIHLFDISNPSSPQYIRKLRMASTRQRGGRSVGLRRAHRDRGAGPGARQPLPLRRRLERLLHGHGHRPHQALRPDAGELPPPRGREPPVPRQQRDHGHRQPRDVRGRQRLLGVQVRPEPRRRRAGRDREPDAPVLEVDGRRRDRPLGVVLLRRQGADLRPRAGRRLAAELPGGQLGREQVAVLHGSADGQPARRRSCTRARRPTARTARGTTST